MAHNASLIQMGSTQSSAREVDSYAGSPATFKAGLCVHLTSAGALSLTASQGSKLGISLGRSLSNTDQVAVCRKGLRVPILLANGLTPVIGAAVQISTTTGTAVASGTTVNAVYVSGVLSAVDEDGVAIADGCALIDFPGGL
jgi:subtilisin family serine protease